MLTRVFEIRVPNSAPATAFIYDHEGNQYIFTANHVVENLGEQANIQLLVNKEWRSYDVKILHGESSCNDVAVLIPPQTSRIVNSTPIEMLETFLLGGEIYFLGFPYGLSTYMGNIGASIPLVKHGYISAIVMCSDLDSKLSSDQRVMLLDGFNNIGFSGGPVIMRDTSDSNRALKVVGIISGFRAERTPVVVDGQRASNVSVDMNTGIIVAVTFERAVELIRNYKAKSAKPKE